MADILSIAEIAIPILGKLSSLAIKEYKDLSSLDDGISELKSNLTEVAELLNLLEDNQPKSWLEKRQSAIYDAEDFISSWDTKYHQQKMKKLQVFKILPPVIYMHNASGKLKEITDTLAKIIEEGRENMKTGIMKKKDVVLRIESGPVNTRETVSQLPNGFVGREGQGGLGKTYLAQLLYNHFNGSIIKDSNDNEVPNPFHTKIWVSVTENFSIKQIFRYIVVSDMQQKGEDLSSVNILNLDQLLTRVKEMISGKRFLIVLDDVWTYTVSEMEILVGALRLGYKGSKVLVTSRSAEVLNFKCSETTKKLQGLSVDNSWLMFEELAFEEGSDRQELEEYGRTILKRCDGLPLAIKQMEALLRGKNVGVWKRIAASKTWDIKDDEVLPALRLSYNRLPSEAHKKCFAYCALYPKKFLFAKDEMVRLWMAEEFVKADDTQKTEDIGCEYFEDLAKRFFFEPSNGDEENHNSTHDRTDIGGRVHAEDIRHLAERYVHADYVQKTEDIGCEYFMSQGGEFSSDPANKDMRQKYKMHDLIHDLAESVSRPFSSRVIDNDTSSFTKGTRHVSLLAQQVGQPTLEIIKKSKKLRTILFPVQRIRPFGRSHLLPAQYLRNIEKAHVAEMLLARGPMRVLDLSCSKLDKLPDSIGELKLLHYLDVSKTQVRGLPDSVCNLLHLQTLKLWACPWIFSLPKKFSKLVKLRHLELDEMFWRKVKTIPQSMGCLTNLHNLHKFQVGCTAGYKLEELKNIKYLTGPLHISNLENAVDAAEANLKEKENIDKVVYEWSNSDSDLPIDEAVENQILEELRPPPKITELKICHYRGTAIPSWIRGGQFRDLATLVLSDCGRVKILSFGNLPNLTQVQLKNMKELEEWREEEYQSLDLEKIYEKDYQPIKWVTVGNCPNLTKLPSCFSKLHALEITKCNKLEHIPFGRMSFVTLEDNDAMKHWGEEQEEVGRQLEELESLLEINNFTSLSEELPVALLKYMKTIWNTLKYEFPLALINLKIRNCPELCAFPTIFAPQNLEISGCKSLTTLPDNPMSKRFRQLSLDSFDDATLLRTISSSPTLLSLVVSNISAGLRCFPKLPSLPKLQTLHIHNCADLEYLSTGENRLFEEGFTSLHVLSIKNCPKLKTLPAEGLPISIKYLSIGPCKSLTSFGPPDVLKELKALEDLYIEDCPQLQSMPADGLSSSILHLRIQGCPSLIKACGKDGIYRPHISDDIDLELIDETPAATSSSSSQVWYNRLTKRR